MGQDTRINMAESIYCPPELRLLLISYAPKKKKKFLNKVWIVRMQEENQHSLQRKQGAGVRRKETGSERSYGHNFYFLKNYIEV